GPMPDRPDRAEPDALAAPSPALADAREPQPARAERLAQLVAKELLEERLPRLHRRVADLEIALRVADPVLAHRLGVRHPRAYHTLERIPHIVPGVDSAVRPGGAQFETPDRREERDRRALRGDELDRPAPWIEEQVFGEPAVAHQAAEQGVRVLEHGLIEI